MCSLTAKIVSLLRAVCFLCSQFCSLFRAVCSFYLILYSLALGLLFVLKLCNFFRLALAGLPPFGGSRLGGLWQAASPRSRFLFLSLSVFFLSPPSPPLTLLSFPCLALPVLSAALGCCVSLPLPGPFPAFFSACLPSSFSSSLPVSLFLCLSVSVSHSLFLSSSLSSFSHLCFPPSLLVSLRLSFCLFPSLVCRSLGHPFFLSRYFCLFLSVSPSLCLSVLCLLLLLFLRP